jgi:GxxExxY protein
MNKDQIEFLAHEIVGSAIEVHKQMGPGLLEFVYVECLMQELLLRNISGQQQVHLPLLYKGIKLNKDFYIDLLVEEIIIIEVKACECLLPVHEAQLLSYLKLADIHLGFLINFNIPLQKNGIKRMVNNY